MVDLETDALRRTGPHLGQASGSEVPALREDSRIPFARVEAQAQVARDGRSRRGPAGVHPILIEPIARALTVIGRKAMDPIDIRLGGGVFYEHGYAPHDAADRLALDGEMVIGRKSQRREVGGVDLVVGLQDMLHIGFTRERVPQPKGRPGPVRVDECIDPGIVDHEIVIIVEHIDVVQVAHRYVRVWRVALNGRQESFREIGRIGVHPHVDHEVGAAAQPASLAVGQPGGEKELLFVGLVDLAVAVVVEAVVSAVIHEDRALGLNIRRKILFDAVVDVPVAVVVDAVFAHPRAFIDQAVEVVVDAVGQEKHVLRDRQPDRIVPAVFIVVDIGPFMDLFGRGRLAKGLIHGKNTGKI